MSGREGILTFAGGVLLHCSTEAAYQGVAKQLNIWQGSPTASLDHKQQDPEGFQKKTACTPSPPLADDGLPAAPCLFTSGRETSGGDTLGTSLLHIWELRALLHCAGAGRVLLVLLFQSGPESR